MAEARIEDEIVIDASAGAVWEAIKDPAAHAEWHPFVTRISGEHSLGATRTCFVTLSGKTGRTSERCIAEQNARRIAWRIEEDTSGFLRLVSDWTAGFRLEPVESGATRVTAESTFRPRNPFVRLMLRVVRRKLHTAQEAILAGLKRAAERAGTTAEAPH